VVAEAVYLSFVLAAALVVYYTQWVRPDLTAFLVLLAMVVPWRAGPDGVTGILATREAFSGFGSPALVMVACMFVVGVAMVRTGAADLIGRRILDSCAHNELLLQAAVLAVTTLFSTLVNDTTTVLVWMPIVIAVCRQHKLSPSRYLLLVAYGSLLGGQWTLIGTRSNIVVSDFLRERSPDGQGFGFFEFTPIAAVVFVACAAYFLIVGRRFLPSIHSAAGLADEYQVKEYLTEIMIMPSSTTIGRTLDEVDINGRFSVTVLSIIRGDEKMPAEGWMHLEPGDVFVVQGEISKIAELLHSPDFQFKEQLKVGERTLRSIDLMMVEAIVAPNSSYEGRTLEEIHFARDYGLTVMGISRHGHAIRGRPTSVPLQFGDSLLLVGHPQGIEKLRGHADFILLENVPFPVVGRKLAWMTLAVVGAAVSVIVARLLEPVVAVAFAAVLLVLLGCVKLREAYQSIEWSALVVVGGMIPFGLALEKTGTAERFAEAVVGAIGVHGAPFLLGAFLLLAVALTQLIENAAVAIVLSPIGYGIALEAGLNPRPFLLGMAIVVSAAFMTPIAHESTILVMGAGRYRFAHYLAVGTGFALITWLVVSMLMPSYLPL
jgi:di/tricarboxylate transporter